jgi:uncharacterized protein
MSISTRSCETWAPISNGCNPDVESSPPSITSSQPSARTWCVLCHASALLGFVVPWIFHILGPLVVWLAKRGESAEIDAHGKESLNFQISMLIYNVIAGVLCLVVIGFFLLIVLHFLNLVLVIVASIQASEGKLYRYPLNLRLLK